MKLVQTIFAGTALLLASAVPALAEGMRAPITDEMTQAECSACHTAYAPVFLPARSWTAIMGDLANHFGEDASLPADKQAAILSYLVANAADSDVGNKRIMRRIASDATPLRITELPWWKRAHDEVSSKRFTSDKVKSASNCIACHTTADKGNYFED
jgi:mono/diheme cytochrome c family protein